MRTALLLVLLLIVPSAASAWNAAAPEEPRKLLQVIGPIGEPMPTHAPVPTMANGIGPGSNLFMEMEGVLYGCTANFLWRSATGQTYLGAAGHCFVPPGYSATHGAGADWNRLDTKVWVCVSSCRFGGMTSFLLDGTTADLGPVAYARQTGPGGDVGNDFGIVEVPAALASSLRPSMPVWGGPTSATGAEAEGGICMYGNGVGVAEVYPTMARAGFGLGSFDDGSWQAAVPSEVGDSGSGVITCDTHTGGIHGRQPVGILTHGIGALVATVPALAFGTTTEKAIAMAYEDAGLAIAVVPGA